MSTASTGAVRGMTRPELLALPVTIDVVTAGRAIGVGRARAYEMARTGELPVRVLHLGRRYRVVTADLHHLLGIERHESD